MHATIIYLLLIDQCWWMSH